MNFIEKNQEERRWNPQQGPDPHRSGGSFSGRGRYWPAPTQAKQGSGDGGDGFGQAGKAGRDYQEGQPKRQEGSQAALKRATGW